MTLSATISVVLADDHAMVREALAQILHESGCLRIVGQAANGPETLDTVAKTRPAAAQMEIRWAKSLRNWPSIQSTAALTVVGRAKPRMRTSKKCG